MFKIRALIIVSVIAMALPGAKTSWAGEYASSWQDNPYARARLISTGNITSENKSETINAGVQIELDPGWKTYWRVPGDSGIPPQVIWKGSTNVKSIEMRWPAPLRFIDQYGMSIGYINEIVLPVTIVPEDKNAAVNLALELNYAVCADVCLPAHAVMKLEIKPEHQNTGPFKRKLERFADQVPKAAQPAQGLRLRKLDVSDSDERVLLSFEVEMPGDDVLVDVFVEGNEALFFGTPKKIVNKDGLSQVELIISGAESAGALAGNKLRFTLVGEKSSVDQYWTVGG